VGGLWTAVKRAKRELIAKKYLKFVLVVRIMRGRERV